MAIGAQGGLMAGFGAALFVPLGGRPRLAVAADLLDRPNRWELAGPHRPGDQVQWHEVGAWIWVALLINAIVTGGYQLLATAGGTTQGQPAIIR